MDNTNHTDLIQAAQNGDDQAFATLINQHQTLVRGTLWSILQDFDDAEDATQEAFVLAYRNLSTLKDPQKFTAWLYTIARNVANKTIRKKQLQARGLSRFQELSQAPKEEPSHTPLNKKTLKQAFQTLSQPDRTVTTLFHLVGLSQDEIAKTLNIPTGTVKSRLHRSKNQLKRRLLTMAKDTFDTQGNQEDYGRDVIGGMRGVIHWDKLIQKDGLEDFRPPQGKTEADIQKVWSRTNDTIIGNAPNSASSLVIGDASWKNYELSMLITPISGGNAQVLFRLNEDSQNWYMLDFLLGWSAVAVSKIESGNLTKISVVNYSFSLGQEYDVQIAARDASITTYVDGKLINQVTDFSYKSGPIALNVWHCKTAFRDIRYRLLH